VEETSWPQPRWVRRPVDGLLRRRLPGASGRGSR
jgi:hypothetical protein